MHDEDKEQLKRGALKAAYVVLLLLAGAFGYWFYSTVLTSPY